MQYKHGAQVELVDLALENWCLWASERLEIHLGMPSVSNDHGSDDGSEDGCEVGFFVSSYSSLMHRQHAL